MHRVEYRQQGKNFAITGSGLDGCTKVLAKVTFRDWSLIVTKDLEASVSGGEYEIKGVLDDDMVGKNPAILVSYKGMNGQEVLCTEDDVVL